jgi:AcrR family transcriptional regulator
MNEPRDRILNCACELYLKDGFEGFSMRKLAREVGVTAPALYRHYENREELLLEVVGEAHKILAQYLYRSLTEPTPQERFGRAGEAYLEFALDHPRYFQMIHSFAEFMGLEEVPEAVEDGACAIQRFWDDRVRECMDAGVLRVDAPEQIGLALWAQGYGLISLYLRGLLQLSEEEFRQAYSASFARILRGMATGAYSQDLDAYLAASVGES